MSAATRIDANSPKLDGSTRPAPKQLNPQASHIPSTDERGDSIDPAPAPHAAPVELLKETLRLRAGGLSIIPASEKDKRPRIDLLPRDPDSGMATWKPFELEIANEQTVRRWCARGLRSIAVVAGAVSGGEAGSCLLILDFDEARLYRLWCAAVGALADGLPVQQTGREGGGFQVYLRCAHAGCNQKLAWVVDADEPGGRRIAIETRGEGGYALVAPSLHPSGRRYRVISGDLANIPMIPQERADALLAAARSLDEAPLSRQQMEAAERRGKDSTKHREAVNGQGSVIDEYNRRTSITDVLEQYGYTPGVRGMYARPGRECSLVSVTIRDGRSFHHSTNDALNDGYWHRPFDIFCHYEHGGDCRAAVKAVATSLGIQHTVKAASAPAIEAWPEPVPLPPPLPPVQPFSDSLLPASLRPWIRDVADRIQCPPDFPAVAAIVALAAVVGRNIGIRPKRHDDWLVIPNLWGMIVGRPGIMKTPALKEPLKPLWRWEQRAREEHEAAMQQHAVASAVGAARQESVKRRIKDAARKGEDVEAAAAELINEAAMPDTPVAQRLICNDATVEMLGVLLNQNPRGLLCFRDELIGLLKNMDKDGQESARAFYLESWNGDGPFFYDRIGRGTLKIDACCLSVIGGIQPGPLAEYLRGAVNGGGGDDGLVQRFQLAVYPDVSTTWVNVDRWPNTVARDAAYEVYDQLAQLNPADRGAVTDSHDPGGTPFLRFDDAAQEAFDVWRAELERRLRSGEEVAAMEAHLSKFRKLVPAMALLIHLADSGCGPVTIDAAERAIRWAEYLETHARRIYAPTIDPGPVAARVLARRIQSGELLEEFTARDIYRRHWTGLSDPDTTGAAIAVLEEHGWIREFEEETLGRKRIYYRINPQVPVASAGSKEGGWGECQK